jgi:hypothetical protein
VTGCQASTPDSARSGGSGPGTMLDSIQGNHFDRCEPERHRPAWPERGDPQSWPRRAPQARVEASIGIRRVRTAYLLPTPSTPRHRPLGVARPAQGAGHRIRCSHSRRRIAGCAIPYGLVSAIRTRKAGVRRADRAGPSRPGAQRAQRLPSEGPPRLHPDARPVAVPGTGLEAADVRPEVVGDRINAADSADPNRKPYVGGPNTRSS